MSNVPLSVETALVNVKETNKVNDKLIKIAIWLAISNVLAMVVVLILATRAPIERYFGTGSDGRIIPVQPTSKPLVSRNDVSTFAALAFGTIYGYDFVNWRRQIDSSASYFTQAGFQGYLQELERSGNLDTLRTKKLVATATVTGAVVVTKEGLVGDVYQWEVEFPALLSYQSASETFKQDIFVTMRVVRLPSGLNMRSIGVDYIQLNRTKL